ncbi:hypothetical protein KKI23_03150 [Patescibacteria group bacterium]|nr:hypothetical protein [Patescibacteria group bacterium]
MERSRWLVCILFGCLILAVLTITSTSPAGAYWIDGYGEGYHRYSYPSWQETAQAATCAHCHGTITTNAAGDTIFVVSKDQVYYNDPENIDPLPCCVQRLELEFDKQGRMFQTWHQEVETYQAHVIVARVRIYDQPNTNSKVIGRAWGDAVRSWYGDKWQTVSIGEFRIIGEADDFYKIRFGKGQGFISRQAVKRIKGPVVYEGYRQYVQLREDVVNSSTSTRAIWLLVCLVLIVAMLTIAYRITKRQKESGN